jgi:DNA polymerase III subunit beta
MKTILSVNELNKAIKEVNKVKAVKGITATENITIQVENGNTYLIKDNFDSRIKKKVTSYKNEAGFIALDTSSIKLISKLKNDEIIINENEISLGKKKIKFINQEALIRENLQDEITTFTVTQKELLRMLEVSYCKAKDETRPILKGICFNNNETCSLDGYRMSVRKSELYNNESEFVVNGESIDILKSLLKKNDNIVNISVYEKNVIFNFDDTELTCKLLEGEFINYKSLLPQDNYGYYIKISDTSEIMESLDIMKEVKNGKESSLTMFAKDQYNNLTLQANNSTNTITDTMEKSIYKDTKNDTGKIAFKTIYMIDAIKNNNNEAIDIFYLNNVSPMIIYTDNKDNFELVLPVRLKQV